MAVDSQGVVYITDLYEGCVQKFSISGQFIGKFGSPSTNKGELTIPVGIAIDDKDLVYISETELERVSVFTSTGNFIHCFQTCDEDLDYQPKPNLLALAIDKSGNLDACKTKQGQVVIF